MIYSSKDKQWDRNDPNIHFVTGVYLHGALQEHFGYDTIGTNMDLEPGVSQVSVHGFTGPCTAFIWECAKEVIENENVYSGRGLIVANSDTEGIDYALSKYNARALCI